MSKLVELAEKEVIRGEILEMVGQAEPVGASLQVLRAGLKKMGMDVSEADLEKQVCYLEGKGLLYVERIKNTRLGLNRMVAHITPAGTDVLEGNAEATGTGS